MSQLKKAEHILHEMDELIDRTASKVAAYDIGDDPIIRRALNELYAIRREQAEILEEIKRMLPDG